MKNQSQRVFETRFNAFLKPNFELIDKYEFSSSLDYGLNTLGLRNVSKLLPMAKSHIKRFYAESIKKKKKCPNLFTSYNAS